MVLYIFEVSGTQFIKMGFTNGCPWNRICDGFWKQVHPEQCCGKLGWDDLQLIHMSPGTLENEAWVKGANPPEKGEFWHRDQLPAMLRVMAWLAMDFHGCTEENWTLPLPPRPERPAPRHGEEKLECCGGELLPCYGCGKLFKLWIRLQTHKRESCPVSAEAKAACRFCGQSVMKRHMKRHEGSKRCRDTREQ